MAAGEGILKTPVSLTIKVSGFIFAWL